MNHTDENQLDFLYEHGEHVDSFMIIDAEYQLFGISNFFVQFIIAPTLVTIQRISVFDSGERLDKYCEGVLRNPKPWY